MTDESDVVAPLQAAEAATGRALKPWCYDRMFSNVRANWDAHDKTCGSMEWFWPGHSGGVSCPSDLTSCEDCDVTFYNEGVHNVTWSEPGEDSLWLCSCCARKRGYNVRNRLSQDLGGSLIDWEEFPPDPIAGEGATSVAPSEASQE